MSRRKYRFQPPSFDKGVIGIVGGFGSGKSEISVNLARHFAGTGDCKVMLADLDVINPYFRSREAAEELAGYGIKSLVPPGAQAQADLPIIIPAIKSAIQAVEGTLILDVGGDDVGARILASLRDAFVPEGYELLLVLNQSRPFTSTVEGALTALSEIKEASGLEFTGIVSNTHMLEETTAETFLDGIEFSRKVSEKSGLPVRFAAATSDVLALLDKASVVIPVLEINRTLLKPWERRQPSE